jgi:hypothetical protein
LHANIVWRRDSDSDSPGGRIPSITEREGDCHETWTAVVRQKHAWEERWGETERKREGERVRPRDADSVNG